MKYLKTFKIFEAITIDNKKRILDLLAASSDSGWFGSNMKETFQCFRLENEWFDILVAESSSDAESLIKKISDSTISLWEDNLEETFECVITEDIYDDDHKIEYNGWYEDLVEYLTIKVSDKKDYLLKFIKEEVINMELIYDIKEIAMDKLYKGDNLELSIVAYITVEKNDNWYTDFDQEKAKHPGKTNDVNFLNINFKSSDDFESRFDVNFEIMSMFASNVDMVKDALSGEFKLHPKLKLLGIGYKVAILDADDKYSWMMNDSDRVLEEDSEEIVNRIRNAYSDEKIDVGV